MDYREFLKLGRRGTMVECPKCGWWTFQANLDRLSAIEGTKVEREQLQQLIEKTYASKTD